MDSMENENVLIDVSKFNEKIKRQLKINHFAMGVRSFFSFVLIGAAAAYIFSPLSKVKISELKGNYDLTKEDILLKADLNNKSLLTMNIANTIKKLNSYSDIASSKIEWNMTYLNVYVDEVTSIAKTDGDILLTNAFTLKGYQVQHSDFQTDITRHLPYFKDFNNTQKEDAKLFLNNLKCLDKDLFNTIEYLDVTSITKDDKVSNYFGIYFNVNDELLRIRFTKSLVNYVLSNEKQELQSTISHFVEDQMKSEQDRIFKKNSDDIYDSLYECNANNVCKVTVSG